MSAWGAVSSVGGTEARIRTMVRAEPRTGAIPWARRRLATARIAKAPPAARRGRLPGRRTDRVSQEKEKRPRVASPGERSARGPVGDNDEIRVLLRPRPRESSAGPIGGPVVDVAHEFGPVRVVEQLPDREDLARVEPVVVRDPEQRVAEESRRLTR